MEEDIEILKSFVIIKFEDEEEVTNFPLVTLTAYFHAIQGLLNDQGDEVNEQLRTNLLNQILARRIKNQKE